MVQFIMWYAILSPPMIIFNNVLSSQANSGIRNWHSGIGKHALQQLMKIFNAEPFKNSKNQQKEYIANQLKDLNYTYHNPKSHVHYCVAQ